MASVISQSYDQNAVNYNKYRFKVHGNEMIGVLMLIQIIVNVCVLQKMQKLETLLLENQPHSLF